MDNSVSLDNLKVGYGKNTVVLQDVNLSIAPGEIVCLIGANGAGKSTVLKTIVGQLKKIGGRVFVNGEDESDMSEADVAKAISMVITERIHPELMTCFDVVATGRYPYTGRMGLLEEKDITAVNNAIDLVGAAEIAAKDFSKISDGQRQRIMLARAICQETGIMVLDEPTSFLDLQYKLDILRVIKKMAKEKQIAILMSIHELEFVPAIADKVVGVSKDKVFVTGTPKEVITGANLEVMYKMESGTGSVLCEGLWNYANSLTRLI